MQVRNSAGNADLQQGPDDVSFDLMLVTVTLGLMGPARGSLLAANLPAEVENLWLLT